MSKLTVAAAQIACTPDTQANVSQHLDAIENAKQRQIDVLVFPELSLTDYRVVPDLARNARPADAPELRRLADACIGMTAVVGFIERTDSHHYNAAAILRDGMVLHVHRKINLPHYGALRERDSFCSGTDLQLVGLGEWQAATLICADTWDPPLPWLAALQGADLLLLPIASARDAVGPQFDNPAGWDINLRHTAFTYGLPVVMCNHCGTRDGLRFWGGSRILDAHGRTLAQAGETPGLISATLDHADIVFARGRLPTIRDSDPEFVSRMLAQRSEPERREAGRTIASRHE